MTKNNKSLEFALLFTFLFGPFGLLYVSVTYGIILIVSGLIRLMTLGYIGLILVWIISIVFAFNSTVISKNTNSTIIQNTNNRESLLNQLSQLYSLKENKVIPDEIYE